MILRVLPLNDNCRSMYRGCGQNKQMIVKTLVGLDYSCDYGTMPNKRETYVNKV